MLTTEAKHPITVSRIGLRTLGEMKMSSYTKVQNPKIGFYDYFVRLFKIKTRKNKKIVLIVDDKSVDMIMKINNNPSLGYQINYIFTNSDHIRKKYWTFSRIYPIKVNMSSLLRHDVIDEIICCLDDISYEYLVTLAKISKQYGISLLLAVNENKKAPYTASIHTKIAEKKFDIFDYSPVDSFGYTIKKFWDFFIAGSSLLLLSWLFGIIALLIKQDSPGPVYFKQLRVGHKGRKFWIYKFRTMEDGADAKKQSLIHLNEASGPAFKITKDPRITRVGKWLRKTNLDELPQLINILKGEMSLIGPRPMLPTEVNEQSGWQLKRLSVKPGITGPWQIQPNRNDIPFERWMKYDKDYVENWSAWKDISLFFKTIFIMAKLTGR